MQTPPSSEFFQAAPELPNQYEDDRVLRAYLRRKLPPAMLAEVEPELRKLGARVATGGDIYALGREAEAQPPRHVPFDAWGRRVDRIEVAAAWAKLDRISAEEGLVAIAYARKHGALSRIDQFARFYLFGPSSAIYTCPLAMTDGAARALELYGDEKLKATAYRNLTSRDPARFWTSGQWMTERTGGSDVSGTSTVARMEGDGYRLYGTKWFTSATTSQMAMTLARIEGAPAGSRGLSLFYLQLHDADGKLQNIRIHRLKDKLGTKALPTAELELLGAPATLVGGEGDGVKKISALFNITRVSNSCCAVGYMRRGLALARDYAGKRMAFGKPLSGHPLHRETLAALEVEFRAGFQLVFRMAELLGRDECGTATPEELATLRLLTPVSKLFTAKQAVASASEILESFGGAGYVEDTGLPALLRDCQVLAIWEGTTNVLSLDALRAIEREGALRPFLEDVRARTAAVKAPALAASASRVRAAAEQLEARFAATAKEGAEALETGAREFAFGLARVYAGSLLLEQADWAVTAGEDTPGAVAAATRWCGRELAPEPPNGAAHREASARLALDRGVAAT